MYQVSTTCLFEADTPKKPCDTNHVFRDTYGEKAMFIQALKKAKKPVRQAALVAAKRAEMRQRINSNNNPVKLLKLAQNMRHVCSQHPAAAALLSEVDLAVARAKQLFDAAEQVATQVRFDGLAAMQQLGQRPSSRIAQMYKKQGSWTNVHARLVTIAAGSNSFRLLCANNQLALTSEYFIVKHAPFAVTADVLAQLIVLVANAEARAQKPQLQKAA